MSTAPSSRLVIHSHQILELFNDLLSPIRYVFNRYPDNEYLIISENDAWNLLYKLRDIGLDKLTSSLLEITNYD